MACHPEGTRSRVREGPYEAFPVAPALIRSVRYMQNMQSYERLSRCPSRYGPSLARFQRARSG
jgi:hypothetical protein